MKFKRYQTEKRELLLQTGTQLWRIFMSLMMHSENNEMLVITQYTITLKKMTVLVMSSFGVNFVIYIQSMI